MDSYGAVSTSKTGISKDGISVFLLETISTFYRLMLGISRSKVGTLVDPDTIGSSFG